MAGPQCWSELDLQAYLLGDLPERVSVCIAAHLQVCAECEAAARLLDRLSDPLLDSLRQAVRTGRDRADHPALEATNTVRGDSAEPMPPAEAVPVGLTIEGYSILEELGRGGMSIAFKAWQLHPRRLVVLKMILAGAHAGAERRARFLAEADALARLSHPNIVQIHEVGDKDGVPFLTLEFMAGGSLAQKLAGVPQRPRSAATLVEQLAAAMHYAHQQGVIHRDLKPANVLLTADGTPKITDFGLAKQDRPELTATGAILGTPSYMAPEQAAGDNRAVGPAADVYGLGAVLYELLTGRPPFQAASTLDTLEQVRSQEPVSPSQLQAGMPRDLCTICLKCLHKEPARRYANAGELADDLRRFLDGRPIQARPVRLRERAWRWARRNPTLALLIASLSGLALVIVIVSVTAAVRLDHLAKLSQKAEHDAREKLFRSLLDQARATRLSGRAGQHYDSLQALRQAVEIGRDLGLEPEQWLELRNEAIACLSLADFRIEREWDGYPPSSNGLGFDSRYQRYVRSDRDGTLSLRRVADDALLLRWEAAPPDDLDSRVDLRFSGDDRFLAAWYYSRPGQPLSVWELGLHGATRRLRIDETRGICDFTPDGRSLVVGLPDNRIGVFDMASGKEVRRLPPGLPPYQVAVHPDGRLLAISSEICPGVQIRDLDTGVLVKELGHEPGAHNGACNGLAWNPVDKTLAVAAKDFRIHLWDATKGVRTGTLVGHEWEVAGVSFSRSGQLLVSWGFDLTTRIWNLRTGRQLVSYPAYHWIGFSRDDRIATALVEGTRVRLCGVNLGEGCRRLYGGRGCLGEPCFSPDSRILAVYNTSDVVLWDVAGGRLIRRFTFRQCSSALFDPSGDSVLILEPGRVRRWRLRGKSGEANTELKTGTPPELPAGIADFSMDTMAWWGPPGQGLLLAQGRKRLCLARPGDLRVLDADFPQVFHLASSPDGRWVAGGAFDGSAGVRVYDTRTGERVKEWRIGDAAPVFSPDGRWLLISTGSSAPGGAACSLYRVETWELVHSIPVKRTGAPSRNAFSPDGRVLAIQSSLTDIALIDMLTFQELATLRPREPVILSCLCFSPDGRLLASSTAQDVVQLWDLRALHRRLDEMGLMRFPISLAGRASEALSVPSLARPANR